MDLDKIEAFVALAKKTGALELKYEKAGEKFEVSFASAPGMIRNTAPVYESEPAIKVVKKDSNLFEITSPFVGTFYKSSAPGSRPYVMVGDKISQGKALCIIEAMKIMNEIESDVTGEVIEICVENENYVEFGQVLFRIKLS
jgi:acetyl-CoA carboxylase biotin carboxyl carrier protein